MKNRSKKDESQEEKRDLSEPGDKTFTNMRKEAYSRGFMPVYIGHNNDIGHFFHFIMMRKIKGLGPKKPPET